MTALECSTEIALLLCSSQYPLEVCALRWAAHGEEPLDKFEADNNVPRLQTKAYLVRGLFQTGVKRSGENRSLYFCVFRGGAVSDYPCALLSRESPFCCLGLTSFTANTTTGALSSSPESNWSTSPQILCLVRVRVSRVKLWWRGTLTAARRQTETAKAKLNSPTGSQPAVVSDRSPRPPHARYF